MKMDRWGYDETNGIIIGGFEVKYEFWQENAILHHHHIKNDQGKPYMDKIATEYFDQGHDQEAIEWFSEHYPAEYADRHERPIEMRVYDQSGKREQELIDAKKGQG